MIKRESVSEVLKTRSTILAGFAIALLGILAVPARADYAFSFSSGGTTCTLDGATGNTGSGEICSFNADAGLTFGLNDWGSPGVSVGIATYNGLQAAYGMEINFGPGTVIDAAEVATGNSSACMGGSTGGTTFCTQAPTDPWTATIINGGTGIEFIAQNPGYFLSPNQSYFVNIFFDSTTTVQNGGFTGTWFTEYQGPGGTTPEPVSLVLIGSGLAGLYLRSLRKRARRSDEPNRR